MDLRPVVIYHAHCADGMAAAWVFWHTYGNAMEYVPGIYQGALENYEGRDVYFLDFSVPRAIMEDILKIANKVTVLDHHVSALKDLAPLANHPKMNMTNCTTEKSGCAIAWKYVHPYKAMPQLLEHIQDRDLWKFYHKDTKTIMAWFFSKELTFEFIAEAIFTVRKDLDLVLAMGTALLEKHMKDVDSVIDQCVREVNIGGYLVPCACANGWLASDVGNKLSQGKPFAATYFDTESGRAFSLRSNDSGEDVSAVAKLYGGGGHRNAAGFKVDRNNTLARV
jgi:oligoribonuclease NrnB/cAMP/cGMP phosphodiesterase (DHH superfamily)